ncbi:zf-HC2 domain-containing protein [Streptomyces sp. O3]
MRDGHPVHPANEVLRRYARGELPPGPREALEPHLDACANCVGRLAHAVEPVALDRIWKHLDEAIDMPVPGRLERLLLRVGVPGHVARLMAATPALRTSWLCGAALILLFTALAARLVGPADAHLVFLGIAPLLPVAGVALSFGRRWDPAHDIGLVAPMSSLRLVLTRSAVVLGTCVPLSAAAALALPRLGLAAFSWLLPSCALTALTIALSARLDRVAAAGVTGVGWLVALALTQQAQAVASAGGQAAVAGVLLASVAVMAVLRSDFDVEKVTRR